MGLLLLEKARNRRVEALWANRVGTRLKAEMAQAAVWAGPGTLFRALCGESERAAARGSVRLFSARA